MKQILIIFALLLAVTQLASADLFVVSVDEWINCEEDLNNVTTCEKNPAYRLIEQDIMPNIDVHYYDSILNNMAKSKNEKINRLENQVTGYITYSSEITDWYSSMEKTYTIVIILLSLVLINAYYQIYKLKKTK